MSRRAWIRLAVVVAAAWIVLSGVLLAKAAIDLRAGKDAAESARGSLDAASVVAGRQLPELRKARNRFEAAEAATGNPVLAPARFLPVLGRQLRSVHALSGAAATTTSAAVDALERSKRALSATIDSPADRVAQLRELNAAIGQAARRVRGVRDLGPSKALFPPLADAHDELAAQLRDVRRTLDDASAGATAGLRLLAGPRRYLLVAANPAEMRAGSGMWLSGGVLTTDNGRFDLGDISPLYELADPPDGAAPIEDRDLQDRWGELWRPDRDWRGLMTSPRLPAAARLGSRMWEAAGMAPIDGVLVLDPVALAAVMRATGPVEVDGRTVTADEVVPLLLNEQYRIYAGDSSLAARRDSLSSVASAVFEAIDAGRWTPATLAGELAAAVRGRHVMAWSANAAEQRGWVAAGADGDLSSNSLLVSVLNRGGNKLDYFLRNEATVVTTSRRDHTEVTLRLRLTNATPDGMPKYVLGPQVDGQWPPGRYVGVVSVNVPGPATEVRMEGVPEIVAEGPDGEARVVAGEIQLDLGQSTEIVVRFRLPSRHGTLTVEPSGRVPATEFTHGDARWSDAEARVVRY